MIAPFPELSGPVSDRNGSASRLHMLPPATRKVLAMAERKAEDKGQSRLDVLVAGAGYVGLAAAVSLKQARPSLSVAVVDAAPAGVWQKDGRASAIAAAACRMLDRLGVWDDIAPEAQAITEMVITDSRTADPVRPVFLTFDGEVAPGEPFAHMVANRDLNGALRKRAGELGIDIIEGVGVQGFDADGAGVTVHLADGAALRARLLVAADGVKSKLRDLAGIKTVHWSYGQSGIVCTVAHERPHNGLAEEHFLPAGPFATLPLKGNRSSLVWVERTEDADKLVNGDDLVFEVELERRFGLKLGEIKVETKPRAWPLGLTLARAFVAPRIALAGDAAHGIHPIAGQGLNLGFKDVAALAEVIVEADRLGQDIGALDVLERYQQWRRFDTVQMGVTTDVLNRLFSNDIAPIRAARDIGLGIVERLPRLKEFFIRQASGLAGGTPRLLKGEAI
jgi:2-octaprenyl-6-methoxyphenol hydroxylase